MKTTKLFLICLGAGIGFFSSCSKKEAEGRDTTNPIISNVQINGQSSIDTAEAGDTINISAFLKDDEELGKLQIEVKGLVPLANWKELESIDLSGTEQTVNKKLVILKNANPADYIISFMLTDHKFNKANYNTEPFSVINNYRPQFHNVKTYFDSGSYDHVKGDTLRFKGTVTDETDLAYIGVDLNIPPGYSGNQDYFDEQFNLAQPNDTLWDFEKEARLKIYFPPYSKNGEYSLTITAADSEGNILRLQRKVYL